MRYFEFYDKVMRHTIYVIDVHYIRSYAAEQRANMDRFENRGAVNVLVDRGEYYSPDKKKLLRHYNQERYNNFILV